MSQMPQPSKLDRQGFVKIVMTFLGSIMGAVVALPIVSYFISPALETESKDEWVPLGPLEDYPLNEPTEFSFTRTQVHGWERTSQSYGVYVVRHGQGKDQVTVFSNICTHLSCRVTWKEDQEAYICPCHDAAFGLEGEVLKGPPPRPLDQFETKIENGDLLIHLQEGQT